MFVYRYLVAVSVSLTVILDFVGLSLASICDAAVISSEAHEATDEGCHLLLAS